MLLPGGIAALKFRPSCDIFVSKALNLFCQVWFLTYPFSCPFFELVRPRIVPWAPLYLFVPIFWVWTVCHSPERLAGRVNTAPLTIEGHLWAWRSLPCIWVPSHSEEWVLHSPELLIGRASNAPLTIEGHLWAWRSLLSIWVPSHSEEWVLRSPGLCDRSLSLLVELALLPSP